jgi:hypothetical protein
VWIDPATHRVRFQGSNVGAAVADVTVQYLVMEGSNVVRKDTTTFTVLTSAPADMNPTLGAGQSWQIQSIMVLGVGTESGFSVLRITTAGSVAGFIMKSTLGPNEWGIYANYTWTRYNTDGVPYGILGGGGA